MINSKAIGVGFALVLTSISAAQEAPTHHTFGTVNSGAGTRRSGPDGAGSSAGASQDPADTAGSSFFESHLGDGHYDDADGGSGSYGDTGGIFASAENGHAGGSHGPGIFTGSPFFGGSAGGTGGSSGQGSGGGSGSQDGAGPGSGAPPSDPETFAALASPPDNGDGNPPPIHFYEPPPFDFQPPPPDDKYPPQPPGKDAPPTGQAPRTTPVAEPFTLSLFGAGLAGAAALRRRRSKKA